MNRIVMTMAAVLTATGAVFAHNGEDHSRKAAPKKATIICPVTGTKIPSEKAASGKTVYKGKTYYFCCAGCKPRFDKDPAKFAKNAAKGIYEKM